MEIGVYARVSTKDRGQEVENQLVQLREFAEKQGWHISREYIDHETGSKSDRAAFQLMFSDASRRKFTACGVGYKSYTEQYLDSCGIFKDAVIGILAVIAKQERVRLSERTRAGIAIARSKGRQIGRPRLKVRSADIARLMAKGLSRRAVGRELGISEGSVRRMLTAAA